jgi:opacity protein-like surface antigen
MSGRSHVAQVLAASVGSLAAAAPATADEWQHLLAPYVWGASISGTTTVGGVTTDTSLSFGDILDDLEVGFMGVYRASRGRHTVTIDTVYIGLGFTDRVPDTALKVETDLDQVILEADAGYALNESFSILGGLRYVELDTTVHVSSPLGPVFATHEEQHWVDPVIGIEYSRPLRQPWSLILRGDVGGFGVGSDFAWQGLAVLQWLPSPRFGIGLAYRYLDMDYLDGNGARAFKYDMAISGPAAGLVLRF